MHCYLSTCNKHIVIFPPVTNTLLFFPRVTECIVIYLHVTECIITCISEKFLYGIIQDLFNPNPE